MRFACITKIVTKIQKSIAYWMSIILTFFCIIGKPIVLALHKWVPSMIFQRNIYLKKFKYVGNIGKIANVKEILGHHSV
jgi:hypothetical protein